VEILAQSSTAFVLTHNFQGTHILDASRGRLSDSVASCLHKLSMHKNKLLFHYLQLLFRYLYFSVCALFQFVLFNSLFYVLLLSSINKVDVLECCRVVKHDDRLSGLRAVKMEYQAGMWNVNSVMLGGLGKDRQLDEGQH